MKQVDYTGTKTAGGGVGKYPLSTEALDLIQEQITLLETLAGLGGYNYILRIPCNGKPGIAVVGYTQPDGTPRREVLELAHYPQFSASIKWLNVTTATEDITADGETYVGARTIRKAAFSTVKGTEAYDINTFANVSKGKLSEFPTNAMLAERISKAPEVTLEYLRDILAEKLTSKEQEGMTRAQIDTLKTPCVLSCTKSYALFGGVSEYTLIVTRQGSKMVRQEVIQGSDQRYVRTFDGEAWGAWSHQTATATHLDVKLVGTTLYLRHGALPSDCAIVMLRKKRRGGKRRSGGPNSKPANRGKVQKRSPKRQYVHFKGIKLSTGTPGKWYVPKVIDVKDRRADGDLIGKEFITCCRSFFYASRGKGDFMRIQGSRKKIVNKSASGKPKGFAHRGYVQIGVQIARLNLTGGKDGGGEIVRLKWRLDQSKHKVQGTNTMRWSFEQSLSIE